MSIRDTLDRLVVVQAALAITSPKTLAAGKAYRYFPDPQKALPARSFQNEWTMGELKPEQMLRTEPYQIRTQFLAGDAIADAELSEDIATAFWEAYVEAVCQSVRPGGQFVGQLLRLRGAEPTLGLIQRAGKAYIGFESFLTVDITTDFTWA